MTRPRTTTATIQVLSFCEGPYHHRTITISTTTTITITTITIIIIIIIIIIIVIMETKTKSSKSGKTKSGKSSKSKSSKSSKNSQSSQSREQQQKQEQRKNTHVILAPSPSARLPASAVQDVATSVAPPLSSPLPLCSVASLSRSGRCNFRRAALVEPPPNDGMLCSPQLVLHMHGLPASCVRGCPATRTSTTALMVFVGFQGNPYLHHPRG